MNSQPAFADWITGQMQRRNWNQADLARAAGLTPPTLSRLLSGQRSPGAAVCKALARAFDLPVETVYRQAHLLPTEPDWSPTLDEWTWLFEQLEDTDREELLAFARIKLQRQRAGHEDPPTGQPVARPLSSSDDR